MILEAYRRAALAGRVASHLPTGAITPAKPARATTIRCRPGPRLDVELERTATFGPGETTTAAGIVWCGTSRLTTRTAWLQVTDRAVYLVQHDALGADQLLEIPRAAILGVDMVGDELHLRFDHTTGPTTIVLTAWTARPSRPRPIEPVLNLNLEEIAAQMRGD